MDTGTIDLNLLRIASPCPVAWSGMKGTDRERHCDLCRKSVYDTSKMTTDEIRALLGASSGEVCAKLYRRQDGTLVTADCAPTRRRRALVFAMTAVAAIMAVSASAFASSESGKTRAQYHQTLDQFARSHKPISTVYNWLSPPPPPQKLYRLMGSMIAPVTSAQRAEFAFRFGNESRQEDCE
ncbi:hypothetical protein BH09SUM1_BH09SUM1_29950 [soil metagenome]